MKLATMEKILSQLDASFVREIDLAGRGEPTIHPRFLELCQMMAATGMNAGIVTTGVTMTDKNVRAFDEHLKTIRLSVSSIVQETFDKVHIGLKHAQIWRNVAALAKVAAHKTIVHLTGGPVIYDHLPQTVEHLRELGFRRFRLLTLWNRGGYFETVQARAKRVALLDQLQLHASEDDVWEDSGRLRFLGGLAFNKLRNSKYCPMGAGSVTISYKGDIVGCFQDFGHSSIMGHIDKITIREHVLGRAGQLGNMPICQGCDAREVTLLQLLKRNPKHADAELLAKSRAP